MSKREKVTRRNPARGASLSRSAEEEIREAVRRILATGSFLPVRYPVPAERGAQIPLTGQPEAWGNGGTLDPAAVRDILVSLPSLAGISPETAAEYASRGRFLILPGDCDRFVTAAAVLSEILAAGVVKILAAADTPSERDNLARFLSLTRAGLGGLSVATYLPGEYTDGALFQAAASVYGYLASQSPAAMVLSRDSFCRRTNVLRRPAEAGTETETEGGVRDLCSVIAEGRPVVLCSSRTVEGGRTLARCAEVFSPSAVFVIAGEVGRFRDAVIYRPAGYAKKTPQPLGEQVTMFE
ncbi:MAG: hypothetical protein IK132_06975 [Clostridia bacterium]|nr:hypothetical protein [Clostridia bacterium]